MMELRDSRVLSPAAILDFLYDHSDETDADNFFGRLNSLTANVLEDSYCFEFKALLNENGWDEVKQSFQAAELSVETLFTSLSLYIEGNKQKSSPIRAATVDSKNRIKSFAPDMLMSYALEKDFHLKTSKVEPFSVFFDGVCLLADISGFTRLSGKFCEAGKDGIDELQQLVNGYLEQLIKIVYAYRGDVMKFAGDALVCVFQPSKSMDPGKEFTVADACSNAVQCATDLAQICTEQLTIHVAVSCGPICFAVLGGHDHIFECLVSGKCFGHLSQCLEDAGSKETVVSSQLIEMLGPKHRKEFNKEQLSSGNYRIISRVDVNSLVMRKIIKRRGDILMKDSESR